MQFYCERGRHVRVEAEEVCGIVLGLERDESTEMRAEVFPVDSELRVHGGVVGIEARGDRLDVSPGGARLAEHRFAVGRILPRRDQREDVSHVAPREGRYVERGAGV